MKIIDKLFGIRSKKYLIEIRRGDSGVPYWRIVSRLNGQVLSTSETYSSADACSDSALRVGEEAGFEVRMAP